MVRPTEWIKFSMRLKHIEGEKCKKTNKKSIKTFLGSKPQPFVS